MLYPCRVTQRILYNVTEEVWSTLGEAEVARRNAKGDFYPTTGKPTLKDCDNVEEPVLPPGVKRDWPQGGGL